MSLKSNMYKTLLALALKICNQVVREKAVSSAAKDKIAQEITGGAKENQYGIPYINGPMQPHTGHKDMEEPACMDLCLVKEVLGLEFVACVTIQWRNINNSEEDAIIPTEIYMTLCDCEIILSQQDGEVVFVDFLTFNEAACSDVGKDLYNIDRDDEREAVYEGMICAC